MLWISGRTFSRAAVFWICILDMTLKICFPKVSLSINTQISGMYFYKIPSEYSKCGSFIFFFFFSPLSSGLSPKLEFQSFIDWRDVLKKPTKLIFCSCY